jgi:cytochrome P450
MDLKPLWVPVVQRFSPTIGPGGLANALSCVLHADATKMVHVTRYADIREVWEREEDFSVRTYSQRLGETTGPFILGESNDARYAIESHILGQAVRRSDAPLVRRIAREESARAVSSVANGGQIDAVGELASVVSIRTAMRYFGLDVRDPMGLLALFQVTSWYIFAFWFDPKMRDAAIDAARTLRPMLDELVAQRRRAGKAGDADVLGRLLRLSSSFSDGDAGVARSIAGLCSGMLHAPIGLFVSMVDKLLSLDPAAQYGVHELAQSGRDPARFSEYLLEAQRFGAFPGALCRFAERSATIAQGARRAAEIPKGTTVVLWPFLAGFDPEAFPQPFRFKPGRPRETYMTLGHARHHCLGAHAGQTLIEEMARALFALPNLRRAEGELGAVRRRPTSQAGFPDRFVLRFGRA